MPPVFDTQSFPALREHAYCSRALESTSFTLKFSGCSYPSCNLAFPTEEHEPLQVCLGEGLGCFQGSCTLQQPCTQPIRKASFLRAQMQSSPFLTHQNTHMSLHAGVNLQPGAQCSGPRDLAHTKTPLGHTTIVTGADGGSRHRTGFCLPCSDTAGCGTQVTIE